MSLVAQSIVKSFGQPPTVILKTLSFEINDGEFLAITGRSGSGKSTLLYCLSTLDPLSSGIILLDGQNIETLSSKTLHQFRNQKMGFVFQFHYLLPEIGCLDNILFPARKTNQHEAFREEAVQLMKDFEIGHIQNSLPGQISGGERQRVAIARALIMKPKYLFADEPTGSLDSISSEMVIKIFEKVNEKNGTTVIMVTHDMGYASRAKRQIGLKDGAIEFDRRKVP